MPDPDALWRDPAHWTALGYRCKDDPRVIVPKRRASMGWTVNWAHPWAAVAMVVMSALAAGPMLVIVWLGQSGVVSPIGMVLASLVAVPLTIGLLVWFCRYASRVC